MSRKIHPATTTRLASRRPCRARRQPLPRLSMTGCRNGGARQSPSGLKIISQSWRRGGLGSKALVTFTLRNANDYAVKDIEIACKLPAATAAI